MSPVEVLEKVEAGETVCIPMRYLSLVMESAHHPNRSFMMDVKVDGRRATLSPHRVTPDQRTSTPTPREPSQGEER